MRKLSKVAAFVCASLALPGVAQTIQGTITNQNGKPVEGAEIELENRGVFSITNAQGQFTFTDVTSGTNELHVRAPGYAHLHQDITVNANKSFTVTLVLARSAMEVIDVVGAPIHLSATESSIPVHVIGGESLRRAQVSTLGDSLEKLPGINTSFHAKVASTPIIRGLSGPRVLITQNGLDVSDASRVGPDHSVTSEASTAQQIEVLRGPATLYYGSGAIGGVVNVVDKRVPTSKETRGEWLLQHDSVDDQDLGSFNFTTGFENFAFYADGFYRKSNDYEVPVAPELELDEHHDDDPHEDHHDDEHGDERFVSNSAEESKGFTIGGSYLLNNGYVGISVEQFRREYGIPGHSHGGEEHQDEDDAHDEHDEHNEQDEEGHEENTFADLEQTKVQIISELTYSNSFIHSLNTRAGYTDYKHTEFENGIAGTTFENETYELRVDALHEKVADFNGSVSLHYKNSDFEAFGEEAFTPPSETEMFALSVIEERHFDDFRVQLGGRVERLTIDADTVPFPDFSAHGHVEDDHDEGHDDDHNHGHDDDHHDEDREFSINESFTSVSLSAGVVWDFQPGYNLGLSYSRSERAPSAAELLSFGPHIGTRTYEVGALFELEEHDGEMEIERSGAKIELETANNIDLTLRKTEGDVGFILNLFYNQVDNYYYQTETGLFAEDGHDHDEHEDDHDDMHDDDHGDDHDDDHHDDDHAEDHDDIHEGELPVFLFTTDDVILSGFEAQVAWQVNSNVNATFFSDYVRARLKNGGDLPRTPPMRFGTLLTYENEAFSAHLDITRYQKQDRIAEFETTTDGYTLVDLHLSYTLPYFDETMELYFKGKNLTNEAARVHSSFLKNDAPRPGCNLAVGIKGYF